MNKPDDIKDREVTGPRPSPTRRALLRGAALVGSVAATGLIYRTLNPRPGAAGFGGIGSSGGGGSDPLGGGSAVMPNGWTSYEAITRYNNFYEFSDGKYDVAKLAAGFVTRPWTVEVGGLVHKPKVFDLDEILALSPPQERVYRMRCVEGWSMVIPWLGFPLADLLGRVEPMGSAKYVAFQTLHDPDRMPQQSGDLLPWPYVEGLRLDEAMHPLTLLAHGLYGKPLPPQNGAPLRLVVPWKYGFKGIKSVVKITLVERQPPTTWSTANPGEYGFYANVNPDVSHPRWSQARERRIGESEPRPTLMFNGYADEVARLYAGMDLRANF